MQSKKAGLMNEVLPRTDRNEAAMNTERKDIESCATEYDNFLGLPAEYAERPDAAFRVFTAPFERTTSYRPGTRGGPEAIIKASRQVELYDFEIGIKVFEQGIATDRSLDPHCGRGFDEYDKAALAALARSFGDGAVPVLLGGEHTVSIPGIAAAAERYPELTVVHVDAHADLRDSFEEDKYSHASVMRRALDLGGEALKLVQIGVRSACSEEARLIESDKRISLFPAFAILNGDISFEEILRHIGENVYITVDLDGFDPSEAPGVGTPEPGGLSWNWTMGLLERICASKRIAAFDVVELCPMPGSDISDFLAAKLVYRIIGLISRARQAAR